MYSLGNQADRPSLEYVRASFEKKEKKLLTTPLALSQPKALETYDRRIATVVPYYPVFKPPSDLRPRLKSEFKPTRLKYGPIFSIRENAKTSQVQLSFSIKY